MSKIFKKSDLDLVVESTMKEAGLVTKEVEVCEECGLNDCTCDEIDSVEVSTKDLAESVKETTNNLISGDMGNFNKLINYRNK